MNYSFQIQLLLGINCAFLMVCPVYGESASSTEGKLLAVSEEKGSSKATDVALSHQMKSKKREGFVRRMLQPVTELQTQSINLQLRKIKTGITLVVW